MARKPIKGALHALGGELVARNCSNVFSSEALPGVKPENLPVARANIIAQNVINLPQQNLALNLLRPGGMGIRDKRVHLSQIALGDPRAPFRRVRGTEVIVGRIGGSLFQHAVERIWMLRFEVPEQAAAIGANF